MKGGEKYAESKEGREKGFLCIQLPRAVMPRAVMPRAVMPRAFIVIGK